MKYIRLLPDVELYDMMTGELWTGPDGRQPTPIMMTNKQFLKGRLCDLIWGESFSRGKQQEKISVAVDAAFVYVPVEDADHEVLKQIVEKPNPQSPYNPHIMGSIMPFMGGVIDAPSRLPDDWAAAELEARAAAEDEAPKSDPEPEPAAPTED